MATPEQPTTPPVVGAITVVPSRQNDTQSEFDNNTDTMLGDLSDMQTEQNGLADWSNENAELTYNNAIASADSATESLDSASEASGYAGAAESSGNNQGSWSLLSGAYSAGISANHSGSNWVLLSDTVDISAIEPGVSAQWDELSALNASDRVIVDRANAGNIGKLGTDNTFYSGNIDSLTIPCGFISVSVGGGTTGTFPSGITVGHLISQSRDATQSVQYLMHDVSDRLFFRRAVSSTWMDWQEMYHTGNASSLPLTTAFAPSDDNTHSNGDASGRWSEIFAGTGTINTSDAREKTTISTLSSDEINASKQLGKEIGIYKFLSAVESKGDDARKHIGLTVQRAIEIMEANNLIATDYAFICFDEWVAVMQDEFDENEIKTGEVEVKPAGNRYGFRYDQLNQFIIAGINARLDALEA